MKKIKLLVTGLIYLGFNCISNPAFSQEITPVDKNEKVEFLANKIFEVHPDPYRTYTPDEWNKDKEIQPVYYFIDHGCKCRPNEHMEERKYWFVTTGVFVADSTDLRKIAAHYKQFLKKEYDYDTSVLNNVVVRYQRTQPEALATRSKKIERMKERRHRIIGIDFSPNL